MRNNDMSRIHRAVEKADREGLLTWTRGEQAPDRHPTALDERPFAEPPPHVDQESGHITLQEATAHVEREPAPPAGGPPIDQEPSMSPLFVAAIAPTSSAAEQYRLLRTRLEARDGARRTQLLLVTSPRIGDGKTTTSANLALTMAQEFQQRVVLVDADLRRPVLAELFSVPQEPGLVDVLVGAATLDEALVAVQGQHLSLLPAGLAAERSTELLASSMMQQALDALRTRFSRIVVDTPPIALADTHVLARLADGILIVVKSGVTPRPAMERALAGVDRQRILGVVLNEVDDAVDAYSYPGLQPTGSGS
jgi:non-specific protein-tyrosine kinase